MLTTFYFPELVVFSSDFFVVSIPPDSYLQPSILIGSEVGRLPFSWTAKKIKYEFINEFEII